MYVYLSGPIRHVSAAVAIYWRKRAEHILAEEGITALNPLRGKHYSETDQRWCPDNLTTDRAIFTRDYSDVQRSDALLVCLNDPNDKSTTGTNFEVAWAYQLALPIITVVRDGRRISPFMQQATSIQVDNLDEGIQLIKEMLLP